MNFIKTSTINSSHLSNPEPTVVGNVLPQSHIPIHVDPGGHAEVRVLLPHARGRCVEGLDSLAVVEGGKGAVLVVLDANVVEGVRDLVGWGEKDRVGLPNIEVKYSFSEMQWELLAVLFGTQSNSYVLGRGHEPFLALKMGPTPISFFHLHEFFLTQFVSNHVNLCHFF